MKAKPKENVITKKAEAAEARQKYVTSAAAFRRKAAESSCGMGSSAKRRVSGGQTSAVHTG